MAIEMKFDITGIPEQPTLILGKRNGDKIGKINAQNIVIKDDMINPAEISFTINKYIDNVLDPLWNEVKDFRLVYCKEADVWFQMKVDIDELYNSTKNVSCTQLAQAELSQIILYNIEINTENDIARDDYESTVLYNNNNHNASLLHRLMEKANHYQILYVSPTLSNIQRTFTFDGISIYDAFTEISKEIDCVFIFSSGTDNNGNIIRGFSVYDLESNCNNCGNRDVYMHTCSKCGSTDIINGYGEDTTIFVTADELGKDIKFTSNIDSQKNCFKLEAGDDLMTATIRNCNPNGTEYIWYIPNYMKEDMSNTLQNKLNDYDTLYQYYQTDYIIILDNTLLSKYNQLITKYSVYDSHLENIPASIVGYRNLMLVYYQVIDFAMYLKSILLPTVEISSTDAETEIAKLTVGNLSPVSVANLSNASSISIDNAVLSVAKCLVNANFKTKILTSTYDNNNKIWTGNFYVENYSDKDDNATSENIVLQIDADYENFVSQKIKKALNQNKADDIDVIGLFNKTLNDFTNELKKYCLDGLNELQNICQSCIDILIEQGAASDQSWDGINLYNDLYIPYYRKMQAIISEQSLRQNELNIINGKYDQNKIVADGIQTLLDAERNNIHKELNIEDYLGAVLCNELNSYKREDKYNNSNYVSDGLNNSKLFEKALEFYQVARKELYKSAELQHSISATLSNLLIIPKFKNLINKFKTGNWLRILVDDTVYKLRLLNYSIDYDNLENISVNFSDVLTSDSEYDVQQSIIKSMSNITTSYSAVQRQANQGEKGKEIISHWIDNGLDVTNNKIIKGASNQTQVWDEHGILCRQYDPIADNYEDCQLRIINSTLAITDDNWNTVKVAVGKHYYYNPTTNQIEYGYGVNGETIIGKLILGEQLGIYNATGSLTFNHNGFNITNSKNTFNVNPNATNLLTISKTVNNTTESIFYVDENGTLHIKGDGSALDITANSSVTGLSTRIIQNSENISLIANKDNDGTVLSLKSNAVKIAWNNISQYVQFDTVSSRAGLSIYNSTSNRIVRLDNAGLNINNSSGNDLMKLNTIGLNLYGQYDGDSNTYKLMELNSAGQYYYYKNDSNSQPKVVGKIGTNAWINDESFRGLHMGLRYGSSYITWSYQETDGGNYTIKLIYFPTDTEKGSAGIHFKDTTYCDYPVYFKNNIWLNDYVKIIKYENGNAGLYSDTKQVSIEGKTAKVASENGNIIIDTNGYTFSHHPMSIVNCYNDIDMHNYSLNNVVINSSSDIRMKTNVEDCKLNAIDILNQVEIKSFDWILDGKHEDIGIVAQQLQEILPDLVYEDDLTTKLSIQPIKFIPYLIKAIQELSAKTGNKTKNDKINNNKRKLNKDFYTQKEINEFLAKINTPIQEINSIEREEVSNVKPMYLENKFKNKERNKK